jgi:hypothetical protein
MHYVNQSLSSVICYTIEMVWRGPMMGEASDRLSCG